MFRRRGFWFVILLIVLVGGATGYYYYTTLQAAAEAENEEAPLQTTAVRRGDLTISATGAGTIIPATELSIGFSTSGTLTELLVRVGDAVQAGDVLAHLDDSAAQEALANAQLQLTQAAMQTDGGATGVGISYDDINVQQAELNLEVAQAALADLPIIGTTPDFPSVREVTVANGRFFNETELERSSKVAVLGPASLPSCSPTKTPLDSQSRSAQRG